MCGVEEGITQMASSSGSTANGSVVRTDAARPSLRTALERVWPYLPAPAPGVELPHRRHLSLDVPTRMVTHTDRETHPRLTKPWPRGANTRVSPSDRPQLVLSVYGEDYFGRPDMILG